MALTFQLFWSVSPELYAFVMFKKTKNHLSSALAGIMGPMKTYEQGSDGEQSLNSPGAVMSTVAGQCDTNTPNTQKQQKEISQEQYHISVVLWDEENNYIQQNLHLCRALI